MLLEKTVAKFTYFNVHEVLNFSGVLYVYIAVL